MKIIIFILISQLILLTVVAQAQVTKDTKLAAVKSEIEAINQSYFQAFAQNDSSLLIKCYTYDCWIMRPNSPTLSGVDAPLIFFNAVSKSNKVKNGKFITVDLFGNGDDFITEEGFWQTFDATGTQSDHGKYLVLWQKTKEGWKRFRDSFNSDEKK